MLIHRHRQRGWALMEVALATAILIPLGLWALQSQVAEFERARGLANAERTQDFTTLALKYYEANQAQLLTAMADGTGAATLCRLGVNPAATQPETTGIQANNPTKHTCAIDASVLRWKGIAPANFPDLNVRNQRMVAVFRRIYDTSTAPATATDNVELVHLPASGATGLAGYAPNASGATGIDPVVRDAKPLGASGGIIADGDRVVCRWMDANPAQREMCGSQGGWKVNLADFVDG
jgi:hypothetical protein